MPRRVPILRSRKCPSREEVLLARGEREQRLALFVGSLIWPAIVAFWFVFMGGWAPHGAVARVFHHAAWLVPGVAMGFFAGRRAWPDYLPAVVITSLAMFFHVAFVTIPVTIGAVFVLGFLVHFVHCRVTGRAWSDPPLREADAPRSPGSVSTARGGLEWKQKDTIASAPGTGREMRRRRL